MQLYRSGRSSGFLLRHWLSFALALRALRRFPWFFGFRGLFALFRSYRRGRMRFRPGPLKFVQKLFVQPERLPPHLKLMPSELGLFFIGAKIKTHINVCHDFSLRRSSFQVKNLSGRCSEEHQGLVARGESYLRSYARAAFRRMIKTFEPAR